MFILYEKRFTCVKKIKLNKVLQLTEQKDPLQKKIQYASGLDNLEF